MSECRNQIPLVAVIALLVLAVAVAASPPGRRVIRQALFQAGLINAEPMTGLE